MADGIIFIPATPPPASGGVASIAIGSVTSGETPSITNSGTAENMVLDFVLVPGVAGFGKLFWMGTAAEYAALPSALKDSTDWIYITTD